MLPQLAWTPLKGIASKTTTDVSNMWSLRLSCACREPLPTPLAFFGLWAMPLGHMEHRVPYQLMGPLSTSSSCRLCSWLLRSMARWQSHRRIVLLIVCAACRTQGMQLDPLPLAALWGTWGEATPAALILLSCHEEWETTSHGVSGTHL